MSLFKTITGVLLAAVLTACGGGGGDSGSTSAAGSSVNTGSDSTTTTTITAPTLSLVMQSAATGLPVQAIAASNTNLTQLVATLKTSGGAPIAGQTITFKEGAFGSDLTFFSGGASATTDANGVAKVTVQRANLTTFGSSFFTAAFAGSTVSPANAFSSLLTFRADPPVFKVDLRDASNVVTTSIGSNLTTSVSAVLQFEDGTPVANKAVSVSDTAGKVSFPNGSSSLTNSSGVANIVVTRASLSVNGAGTLNVASTIIGSTSNGTTNNTAVAGSVDYQLGTANIALAGLNVGSATALSAYGNRTVSVNVTANGQPAAIPVQVTFGASCGVVSPAVVSTDANGSASTTYTASDPACSGTNVSITAAATGATTLSGTVAINAPVATNVQFVSASPQLIYLVGTVGTTQAQVVFKAVDSSGNPVQNKTLKLSLSNTATGVSLDTLGNSTPISYVTNSAGTVSAAVYSGTVPTSLTVRATLLDVSGNPSTVFSDSNVLTVASGRPTQSALSITRAKASIEGRDIDNVSTTVTLTMADRNGNPVPPGTQVNFVSETGVLIPAVCFVPPAVPSTANSPAIPSSSCSVTLYSSGTRTANGKVAVMAYVAGEEDFLDLNGTNVYQTSPIADTFTPQGRAWLDRVGGVGTTGVYDSGEFQVPRIGFDACVVGGVCPVNTSWGVADVFKQTTIIFASSTATVTATTPLTATTPIGGVNTLTDLTVRVADANGNSMPSGSIITISPVDDGGGPSIAGTIKSCTVTTPTSSIVIGNTLFPVIVPISMNYCNAGDKILVNVTTPLTTGISQTTTSTIFPIQ